MSYEWRARGVAALAIVFASTVQVVAAEAVVLGDSIGVGIATAAGLPQHARPSVSIRRGNVPAELSKVPPGAVAMVSLGTNDALDPLSAVTPAIDRTIDAIGKSGRKAVWLGPPCGFAKWAKGTETLDAYLKARLAGTAIQYVSLRDAWICNPSNRAKDGVHFSYSGYRYLWEKIRRESSLAAEVELARCNTAAPAVGQKTRVAGQFCQLHHEPR